MYDIIITRNGTPDFSSGDLEQTTYSRYIEQIIFAALREMPPDLATGYAEEDIPVIEAVVYDYLIDRFTSIDSINPDNLIVSIDTHSDVAVALSVSYSETMADGSSIEISQEMGYSITGGAITDVPDPEVWLQQFSDPDTIECTFFIDVSEASNRIILPVLPLEQNGSIDVSIYSAAVTPVENEHTFTIPVSSDTTTYLVSHYTEGLTLGSEILKDITVDESITMAYTITDTGGDFEIRTEGSGSITGIATVINARTRARVIDITNSHDEDPVYPLRPVRGRYTAVCGAVLQPGRYRVDYWGITNRRS